jgi:hypothetical protein
MEGNSAMSAAQQTKHTPGPLRIDAGRHGIHIRAGKETDPLGGNLVAQAFSPADARLFAAAPDLLEAAQNLLGLFDNSIYRRRLTGDSLYADAIAQSRAAIAKATGEQQ